MGKSKRLEGRRAVVQGLQSAGLFSKRNKDLRLTGEADRGQKNRSSSPKAGPTNERVKARRRTGGFAEGAVRYDVVRVRARARDGTGRVGK